MAHVYVMYLLVGPALAVAVVGGLRLVLWLFFGENP